MSAGKTADLDGRNPGLTSSRGSAFTLIELLVAMAVIIILAGTLLKTAVSAFSRGARAQTVTTLENLQQALAEYYQVYGSYPPVDFVQYEYEMSVWVPGDEAGEKWQTDWFANDWLPGEPDFDLGYRYGLFSYLEPRAQGVHRHPYFADDAYHERAKERWAGYLDSVSKPKWESAPYTNHYPVPVETVSPYTNRIGTYLDGYGHEVQYVSEPPYQSYTLSSLGPDGAAGTADDIHLNSWNE